MLTNLGRLLRKIRIDHGEILKNMADRFGVTASYLSSVENGKCPIPGAWERIILSDYSLDESQRSELRRAIIESATSIKLDVSAAGYANKEISFDFARKVADLPDEKLQEIKRILLS
jgi:transcriptional regulator with XRE-family HTH domain